MDFEIFKILYRLNYLDFTLFNIITMLLYAVLSMHFNRLFLTKAYFKVCIEAQAIFKPG